MSFRAFFSPERIYAVVGASANESKFGFKVLKWYINHDLPVIPINPTSKEILNTPVAESIIDAVRDLDRKYPGNDGLSVSFITPPHVSLEVLNSIEQNGFKDVIKGVWFQPGAYDSDVIEKSEQLKFDPIIENDECILVSGASSYTKSALKANL